MKVVIAPDSFKGSLTASELCAAIANGVRSVFPKADLICKPLADGGEGMVNHLVDATGGSLVSAAACDPLGRVRQATYGVLGDGRTAVIEMAAASGLPLLKDDERQPLITTTRGTGQLILHALDQGFRSFIIGLGGSATNDGATGMLRALGLQLMNAEGQQLPDGGGALRDLYRIDLTQLDERLAECHFTIACDVTNELCGPSGASAVFGPQKGATPEMVVLLDEGLRRLAECIEETRGIDVLYLAGGGAAGGMGAGMMGFLNAEIFSGIEVVMEASHFEKALQDADYVITGEGRLDEQTLSGKVVAGVCAAASRSRIPVIVLCGTNQLSTHELDELGEVSAFSIVPGPCTLEEAMRHTPDWVEAMVIQIFKVIRSSCGKTIFT
ncbi:glycerate kinase [Paenibacillus baekrokdamisoli]|uniref:Glycerate kinase n=1 Tax=Paenibacillus baekrokdamisoli TaxID=1712516 RepID=A0A3G9J010_9BACL|nr:glycerate kinase [Paenibacillus baekrokdamisoli]MBB3071459.1 glycerate kinase [Paenibacillus baekrokdamisoli]BBH24510.1 glycerate kinase [Paenibacillus baekrokdamisoli]